MPQHESAKKRVRQNAKRRERNNAKRSHLRTMMKKVRASEDPDEAESLLNEVKSLLDRMASKNLIHKNKAANYKSELDKHVQGLREE